MKIVILCIFSLITTNVFAGWGSRSSSFSRSRSYSSPSRSYSKPSSSSSRPSSSSSSYSRSTYKPSVYKPNPAPTVAPPKTATYKKVNEIPSKPSVSSTSTKKTTTSTNPKTNYSSSNSYKASKPSFGSTYLWSAATGSSTMGYLMGGSLGGALLYHSLHSRSSASNNSNTLYNVGDKVTDGKETYVIEKITKGEDIPLVVGTQIKDEKGNVLTIANVEQVNGETTYTLSNGTTVKSTKHDKLVYTFTNGSKAMDMSHFKAVK